MKKNLPSKTILFLLFCIFICLIGCSEEKKEEIATPQLSFQESQALHLAINDEYRSLTIADFSLKYNSPFTDHLIAQKSSNIRVLEELMQTYSMTRPENPWNKNDFNLDTKQSACEEQRNAETALIEQYTTLLTRTDKPDIINVFTTLKQVSEQTLASFRTC